MVTRVRENVRERVSLPTQCMRVSVLYNINIKVWTPGSIFRRHATHCISPYAIVVCVCVCMCMCVCVPRLWTSGKRFEIETSSLFYIARNDTGHNV